MLRAVIFDFDGVIADTERLHLHGFRQALASHGVSVSEADYFARYLGCDDHEGFSLILDDNGCEYDGETLSRLKFHKERVFRELARERVRLFPGVRGLLEQLRFQPSVATAIGSGALHAEITLVLDLMDVAEYFDTVIGADDVDRHKPDPQTFLTARDRLSVSCPGLRSNECVVIEDSSAGLQAARASGMYSVAVATSYPSHELEADVVVDEIGDIDRELLEQLVGDGVRPCTSTRQGHDRGD